MSGREMERVSYRMSLRVQSTAHTPGPIAKRATSTRLNTTSRTPTAVTCGRGETNVLRLLHYYRKPNRTGGCSVVKTILYGENDEVEEEQRGKESSGRRGVRVRGERKREREGRKRLREGERRERGEKYMYMHNVMHVHLETECAGKKYEEDTHSP